MNRAWVLGSLVVLAGLVVALTPWVGMHRIPPSTLWQSHDDSRLSTILWSIRIPRVGVAFLAGAALAVSGMTFQALFRNPLATPFTLGVASGASLGAVIYIQTGLAIRCGWISGGSLFAFAGALGTILLVYGLSRTRQGFSTATLLLAGVAISFFASSLILLMQYVSDPGQTFRMFRWMMGGLEGLMGLESLLGLLPFLVPGMIAIGLLRHELNLLSVGEDLATARGVEVQRVKALLFFVASLMVGAVVSLCGPIGFVGLMAPHVCRLLVGPDHRSLIPATLLFGGTLLTICDTAARTMIAPAELPVGIITALLGGPFFLWLLVTRADQYSL